jgi:hypothetical protein
VSDYEKDKATLSYSVGPDYEAYWTRAKATNHTCVMPAFDTNDLPISPDHFTEKLVGALCEVTFTLRQYAMGVQKKEDGKEVDGYDVFSAQVETVAILKNPPVIAPSPYKGRLTRRPHHKAQVPTRGEQCNAAAAFVPQPNFASISARWEVAAEIANYGQPSMFSSFDGHLQEVPSTSSLATPTTSPPSNASVTQLASGSSPASITTLTSDDGKGEEQSIAQVPSLKRKLRG